MASIVKRGTRAAPQFHVKWIATTADGKPKQIWKRLRGVETRKQATDELARIERALDKGEDPFPVRIEPTAVKVQMEKWAASLENRNAPSDRTIVMKHLIPRFGQMVPKEITKTVIVRWLDEMKEATELSTQTQRHLLSTLSRFFEWLGERDDEINNPVKKISRESRPKVKHRPREWLDDESKLAELLSVLPYPIDLMLALGNRTGMRLGEICGLRMSDLDHLAKGFVTVSRSYAGPLKEDDQEGNIRREKKVPAPADAEEALKLHLARRRLNGAKADDLVFAPVKPPKRRRRVAWSGFNRGHINDVWRTACKAVGLVGEDGRTPTVSWYGATRHTMASRAKRDGLGAEQIAEAMGHKGTAMVDKFYFGRGTQRETFAPALRLPMMPAPTGKT